MSDGARFCNRCGSSLGTEASVPQATPSDGPEPPPTTDTDTTPPDPPEPPPTTDTDTDTTAGPSLAPPPAAPGTAPETITLPPLDVDRQGAVDLLDAPTTDRLPTTGPQMPVLFDGEEDLSTYPESRQRFRVRLVLVLAVFAAAAVVMAPLAGVIDIFTTRPVAGIDQGTLLLEGLGSNLGVGGYVAGALAVVGGLLACFGIRWGAGLAGGAGLALTGWAALAIGLAEIPVARAEAITRNPTTPDPFVLTITRDVGWFLLAGAGLLGALVFLTSLRLAGRGGHRSLDPWIAAVAAVAPLVMAFGPLVPVGGATFSDNWGSSSAAALPAAIFAGRLIQVGLIATAGVIGFLAVRNYGVGLAVGAVSVALWMWISSLGEIGDTPKGIADRNPGAVDTIPHGVTSIGATLTIAFTIIATVAAIARTQRQPRGR